LIDFNSSEKIYDSSSNHRNISLISTPSKCSLGIQKTFYFKEFLQAYPSTLNNQQITNIKRYFIQLMQIFEEHQLIESSYQVVSTKTVYQTNKLTSQNISKGFIIYERLSI